MFIYFYIYKLHINIYICIYVCTFLHTYKYSRTDSVKWTIIKTKQGYEKFQKYLTHEGVKAVFMNWIFYFQFKNFIAFHFSLLNISSKILVMYAYKYLVRPKNVVVLFMLPNKHKKFVNKMKFFLLRLVCFLSK